VHAVRRLEVAQKVAALTAAVGKDLSEWTRAAGEVAALLPGVALKTLAAATDAIVVPDDVLWRVPFEALPAGAGLVGDKAAITYAGSVAPLDAPTPSPVESRGLSVLAVAAPELAIDRVERVRLTSPAWTPRVSDMATREVNQVAATIEATRLMVGAQATELSMRAAGPGTVLHVAAPFAINGPSPLFSRVFLSAGTPGDAADDGVLEAREIFNVETAASMAVLSDGSAAAMRDAASAWPIVQWSWRAAGVRTALMARWPAPSPCGEAFFAEFYRQLADGTSPARAVAAAQAKLRAVELTRHPACWSGWVLIGAS
jgi:CHAT domain-containing protein